VQSSYKARFNDSYDTNASFTLTDKSSGDTISTFPGWIELDEHNRFVTGRDLDNDAVVAEYTGKLLLKTPHIGEYKAPGYHLLYDTKTRLFGVYCPYTNVLVKPRYLYIEPVGRDRYFIVTTQSGKLGYLDGKGKELF
jgi:hypothetical protein